MRGGHDAGCVGSAHLVNHHSKRIAVRLASRTTVGAETAWVQQFWAHPAKGALRRTGGFRKKSAQICQGHEAKICEESGAFVVDEDVCLFRLSAKGEASRGCLTHSFEISVNNLEVMKIDDSARDLSELPSLVNKKHSNTRE